MLEGDAADAAGGNPLARHFTVFSLVRFAFPTIFMMVFFGLYTAVDTMFIARFVGAHALSALNIVTPVINVIVGLGTMAAAGGGAVIARKLGDGRDDEARRDLTLLTLAGLIAGAGIAVAGGMCVGPIVAGLGASEALTPYALEYLSILILFTPANMLQTLFAVFFVTAGRPGTGMIAGVLGGLANALLDYAFIVPLDMGIGGAALATGIGYTIPCGIGLAFFAGGGGGALRFARPRPRIGVLWESCFNGSSEMASQLSAAVTIFFFNAAMLRLAGEDGVAAITIIIYSQFLLTTLHIGFSMGVAPVIGYNFGGRNRLRLRWLFRTCFGLVAGCSALVFAGLVLWGPDLVRVFATPGSPVHAMAERGLSLVRYGFLLCGINIFASAFFTALSNGLASAAVSFSRTFVFLLAGILALPVYLGVDGVWIAMPVAELLAFVLAAALVAGLGRRYGYL